MPSSKERAQKIVDLIMWDPGAWDKFCRLLSGTNIAEQENWREIIQSLAIKRETCNRIKLVE